MFELRSVSVGYGERAVLQGVSFTAQAGRITALVGPNGCGKTTLLKAMARQLPLQEGEVRLRGCPLQSYTRREFARMTAFMPQVRAIPEITVRGLVSHGRFPYLGLSRQMTARDRRAVEQAMQAAGVERWAQRDLRELSGGERQRVYLPWRWPRAVMPSCWTNPRPTWMWPRSLNCWSCCARWRGRGGP